MSAWVWVLIGLGLFIASCLFWYALVGAVGLAAVGIAHRAEASREERVTPAEASE